MHDDLVTLQAKVSETGRFENQTVLFCRCAAGAFEAIVPAAPSEWNVPAPGSLVALTGIMTIHLHDVLGLQNLARDFTVQMRTPADVAVIAYPPWWTVARIAWLLGACAVAAAAAVSWAFLLRRQVRAQTATIRDQIQREAVYQERMRIAGDLHDNLGASITQIGMLSALAEAPAATTSTLRDHLTKIRERSEQVVRSLDSAVWAANPNYDSIASLIDYLCHFMGDLFAELPVRWRLEAPDEVETMPLEPGVRHHLVLSVSEAVNNALKHSGASEVVLRVETRGPVVLVSTEDNGSGFDEQSIRPGNGLRSIRRRMDSVGGTAEFQRSPRGGTRVVLIVTVAEAQRALAPTLSI